MSKAVVAAMRANQSRRAVELAREMIRLRPDDPDIIYLFGAASLQSGRIADAEAYLERYTRERPSDGRGCVAYALSLAAQPTKIDPARSKLEGCVAMDPANFEATYQLALSHRSSGETEKAIDYLERTVNRAPNYAYAVRDLGVLYLQAGKEAEARVNLEKAAKLAPNDPDTHFQLSRLYNLAGEPVLAKRHFDTFQKLKDQNGH
jgi:tetratricopeptide (TPR) repeat protein